MSLFKQLDNTVTAMIDSRKAFSGVFTKQQLKIFLDHRENELLSIVQTLGDSVNEIGPGIGEEINLKPSNYPLYVQFKKALDSGASKIETAKFLGTLTESCRLYLEILQSLEKDIDSLFKLDRISLLNMRASHLVVSGLLHQSEALCKFTKYTLSYVSSIFLKLEDIPKYRKTYLQNNVEYVADIVNALMASTGATDYKAAIQSLQQNAADYTLISQDATSQVPMIENSAKLSKNAHSLMVSGVIGLNPFRMIGEWFNLIRNSVARFLKTQEDWMRAHVALLNAKLDGLSNTDEEYTRLEKIIARYDSLIDAAEKLRSKVE